VEKFKQGILTSTRRDILALREELEEAGDLIDTQPFLLEIERIEKELIKKGYFDRELNLVEKKLEKKTLTQIEQEGRKIEQQLRSLEGLAAGAYREKVDHFLERYRRDMELLRESGFGIGGSYSEFTVVERRHAQSLEELTGKKREGEEIFTRAMKKGLEECFHLIAIAQEQGEDLEESLRELERLKELSSHREKVARLVRLKEDVSRHVEKPFLEKKKEVEDFVGRALSIMDRDFIEEEAESLREVERELARVKGPAQMIVLENLQRKAREGGLKAMRGLSTRVENLARELDREVEDRRGAIEELKSVEDFNLFARKAGEALEELVEELEKSHIENKILSSYSKVEPLIDKLLKGRKSVSMEEVKVKYAESFMKRYAERHPGVKFKAGEKKLVRE